MSNLFRTIFRWKLARRPRPASTATRGAPGPRGKGQALVEVALSGLILGMLLAAAVDFGRAMYTAGIVENMAGEGAAYAALWPERDYQTTTQRCSILPYLTTQSIQYRARRVAKDRGLAIDAEDQNSAVITITPASCRDRCAGESVMVSVTWNLNDLFLPRLVGMTNIQITRTASQLILRDPPLSNCGN